MKEGRGGFGVGVVVNPQSATCIQNKRTGHAAWPTAWPEEGVRVEGHVSPREFISELPVPSSACHLWIRHFAAGC